MLSLSWYIEIKEKYEYIPSKLKSLGNSYWNGTLINKQFIVLSEFVTKRDHFISIYYEGHSFLFPIFIHFLVIEQIILLWQSDISFDCHFNISVKLDLKSWSEWLSIVISGSLFSCWVMGFCYFFKLWLKASLQPETFFSWWLILITSLYTYWHKLCMSLNSISIFNI